MRDDAFRSLLSSAETGVEPTSIASGELVRRVKRRYETRRQRRRVAAIAAPLLLVALLTVSWRLSQETTAPRPATVAAPSASLSSASFEEKIARLQAESDMHLRVARYIRSLEARDRALERLRRAEEKAAAEPTIEEHVEVVAYGMVLRADALRAAMQPVEEAVTIYRNVVRLFPASHSAASARQRLMALGFLQGDT